ncbi:ABC transporter permease [Nocardioides insulae]|uniref:ABC transporter permease n=1 Tax=Nocardioides insulae TaxID=394734 RepID=UPI000409D98F|nr:ABC transporter permease [Nocardioides insulae]
MSATIALTTSSWRAYLRDKASLFFTFAFPLAFLVLFGAMYRDQELEGVPYVQYVASGVLSWGVANAAVFGTAFTLMQWRRDDLLRLIRLTPTRVPSVLGARLLITLAIAACQVALFIGVAMLPAFGLSPARTWPLLVPVLVCGVMAFLAVGALIGTYAETPEAVAAVSNILMVPMAFLSGAFIPLAAMPDYLQDISRVLPLTYLNEAAMAALNGTDAGATVATSSAALLGFAVVFSLVLLRVFRWDAKR